MAGEGNTANSDALGAEDVSGVVQSGDVAQVPAAEIQTAPETVVEESLEERYNRIQAENEVLNLKIGFLQDLASSQLPPQQMMDQSGQQAINPFAEIPGEEIPTAQTVEQLIEQKVQTLQNDLFEAKAGASYARAVAVHNDYNDVARMARTFIDGSADRDLYYQMIMQSKDPAELVYTIGKASPDYHKAAVAASTQKVVQQINGNLSRPATLSQTPAAASPAISLAQQINDMSESDFIAYKNRIKNGEV